MLKNQSSRHLTAPFFAVLTQTTHNGCFWNFCPKSIWCKSQSSVPKSKKSKKVKALLNISFESWLLGGYIFSEFYNSVPKIEVCLRYVLDKNSRKQPLCTSQRWWFLFFRCKTSLFEACHSITYREERRVRPGVYPRTSKVNGRNGTKCWFFKTVLCRMTLPFQN